MRPRYAPGVTVLLLTLIAAIALVPPLGRAAGRQRTPVAVKLTGVHILLNQAYQMVLEGSNLVMLGELEGTSAVGKSLIDKGRRMMDQGRRLIADVASGQDLAPVIREHGTTPRIKHARDLAAALLDAADAIETYLAAPSPGGHKVILDQLFMLINHGMKMATEGANMIMNGRIGLSDGASDFSQRHGRAMMRDGRVVIVRLSTNTTMKELEELGSTAASDPRMDALNKSIVKSLRIIDTLARL